MFMILYWKVFHRHPTTSFHFRPLNYYFFTMWAAENGPTILALPMNLKFNIKLPQTAILKGTAACSLRCHLGMLQILFKNTSCHLIQKATSLHIPQAVKQHSQMLLELTLDVFIQPTFTCVLPLHCFSLHRRLSLTPSNHRPFLPFWWSLCPMKHICLAFTGEVSWEGPEWCTLR